VNGLDPEGIVWIRNLLRSLAADGRTVFVSSHLMSEMSMTADRLIVVGRGRLIADASVDDVRAMGDSWVRVRSPRLAELLGLLRAGGATVVERDGFAEVRGLTEAQIGDTAAAHAMPIHQLYEQRASLEEVFFELTDQAVEFHGSPDLAKGQP
jgi:ABC-2 type transport system ATP-binding protein